MPEWFTGTRQILAEQMRQRRLEASPEYKLRMQSMQMNQQIAMEKLKGMKREMIRQDALRSAIATSDGDPDKIMSAIAAYGPEGSAASVGRYYYTKATKEAELEAKETREREARERLTQWGKAISPLAVGGYTEEEAALARARGTEMGVPAPYLQTIRPVPYRKPERSIAQIEAEAEARARGYRKGAPPVTKAEKEKPRLTAHQYNEIAGAARKRIEEEWDKLEKHKKERGWFGVLGKDTDETLKALINLPPEKLNKVKVSKQLKGNIRELKKYIRDNPELAGTMETSPTGDLTTMSIEELLRVAGGGK